MTGLRNKQKAAREKRILTAAILKFRAESYRSVRIEDLADRMVKENHNSSHNKFEAKSPTEDSRKKYQSRENLGTSIQMLEQDFKFRKKACQLRQKEIRKFITFIGELSRCFTKFSSDIFFIKTISKCFECRIH